MVDDQVTRSIVEKSKTPSDPAPKKKAESTSKQTVKNARVLPESPSNCPKTKLLVEALTLSEPPRKRKAESSSEDSVKKARVLPESPSNCPKTKLLVEALTTRLTKVLTGPMEPGQVLEVETKFGYIYTSERWQESLPSSFGILPKMPTSSRFNASVTERAFDALQAYIQTPASKFFRDARLTKSLCEDESTNVDRYRKLRKTRFLDWNTENPMDVPTRVIVKESVCNHLNVSRGRVRADSTDYRVSINYECADRKVGAKAAVGQAGYSHFRTKRRWSYVSGYNQLDMTIVDTGSRTKSWEVELELNCPQLRELVVDADPAKRTELTKILSKYFGVAIFLGEFIETKWW